MASSRPARLTPAVAADPFGLGVALASVGVATPDAATLDAATPDRDANDDLHQLERAAAAAMPLARQASYIAGRRALRAAVHHVAPHASHEPMLHTSRGAPHLPIGVTGSLSHKPHRAIAVAATMTDGYLGVDLEERPTARELDRPSIARRILTDRELADVQSLDALSHREATLVRFAIKEAVYKAIDPYVGRYVRFTEVELDVHDDQRATVRLLLPEPVIARVQMRAHWRFDGEYIVAIAQSRLTAP